MYLSINIHTKYKYKNPNEKEIKRKMLHITEIPILIV